MHNSISRASSVFAAAVGVEIDLGSGMEFQRAQPCGTANRGQRAIWPGRHVRQLCRAVTADAIAALEVRDQVSFLSHDWKAGCETHAAADPGVVECTSDRRGTSASGSWKGGKRKGAARVDAIAEIAEDSDHFVVAPTRVKSRFDQKIGGPV